MIVSPCLWFWISCRAALLAAGNSLPSDICLVETAVEDQYPHGDEEVFVHRVAKVYAGPPSLTGQTFEYRHTIKFSGQISGARLTAPSPKTGESAIWLVRRGGIRLNGLILPLWGVGFPSRCGVDPDYDNILALAKAIEDFQRVDARDSLEFLKDKAHSPVRQVAHWAVTTLSREKPELFEQALDHFIRDRELSVAAQVALDPELIERQGEFWQHSDLRGPMLNAWLSADLTRYEEGLVKERLSQVIQRATHLGLLEDQQAALAQHFRERFSKTPKANANPAK